MCDRGDCVFLRKNTWPVQIPPRDAEFKAIEIPLQLTSHFGMAFLNIPKLYLRAISL